MTVTIVSSHCANKLHHQRSSGLIQVAGEIMSVFQVEDLRSARNYFYIGRYAKAMEEATAAQHPDSETLRLRAWAELSPADVVAAISSSAPTPHQAVKLYATYKLAKDAAAKEAVIATLTNYLSDADIMTDQTLRIIGAQLFVLEKDYKRALSTLNSADNSMEKYVFLFDPLVIG